MGECYDITCGGLQCWMPAPADEAHPPDQKAHITVYDYKEAEEAGWRKSTHPLVSCGGKPTWICPDCASQLLQIVTETPARWYNVNNHSEYRSELVGGGQ